MIPIELFEAMYYFSAWEAKIDEIHYKAVWNSIQFQG
jgi:hypothetical protein